MEEDININIRIELMEKNLERVINWVNNCDQKASILLTLLGVVVTLVFTSGVFEKIDNVIIAPFLMYIRTGEGTFCWLNALLSLFLLISILSVALSLKYLLAVLTSNIDYDKIRKSEPNMVEKSYIFFGGIADMKYNDFYLSPDSYYEDLRSQVYANSLVCKKKFKNYAKALRCIFVLLSSMFLSFLLIAFM